MSANQIQFLLNGEPIQIDDVDPNQTVLDYLRTDLFLTGTKEGCAEGDCGACTVVSAELVSDPSASSPVHWRAINSCIRLVSSLDGVALYTVESLRSASQQLHPVQQAMVQNHASQCGFCTPGFVMSLFALYQRPDAERTPRAAAERALSGNLCRCTGYRAIADAANDIVHTDQAQAQALSADVAERLKRLKRGSGDTDVWSESRSLRPQTITDLLQMRRQFAHAQLIAGCTDVGLWLTKKHQRFEQTIDLTQVAELQRIVDTDQGKISIGAAVRLSEAFDHLTAAWPQLAVFADRFASTPIRNSGTLGGNIANGSAIGDAIPLLMALGTELTVANASTSRKIALQDFYSGHQQNILNDDEVLLWLEIDAPKDNECVVAYKVSKRFDQDISTVCLAARLRFSDTPVQGADKQIETASIAVAGLAATVKRASKAEQTLLGCSWTKQTAQQAGAALRAEFSPIDDMRASKFYRSRVVGALLERAWRESDGQQVIIEELR